MSFELLGINFTVFEQEPFVDQSFDRASLEFFDKANDDPAWHDHYFNYLAAFSNGFSQHELWHKAENFLQRTIQPALEWEKNHPGRFIHKGTAFYFWGMAAICRGELDMGYPLMHQALQEDIRTHQTGTPNTPAFAFATLDYDKQDQAFRVWTQHQAKYLEQFLANYRLAYTKGLALGDFRRRFLASPPSLDIIFLFTYALGKFFLFTGVPPYARQSDFASQLEINLLFDLLLVVDASIKVRNPNPQDNVFSMHATFLSNAAGLGLTQQNIQGEINLAFSNDFNRTLTDILGGAFRFQNGSTLTGLAGDLAIAYGLRNYGAHKLFAAPAVQQRFEQIRQSLFNVLFITVETLY